MSESRFGIFAHDISITQLPKLAHSQRTKIGPAIAIVRFMTSLWAVTPHRDDRGGVADLIDRLQRRDPEALGEAYDRFGRLTYSLILRIVRDTGVAEDLVQEVFLKVWMRAGSFDREKGDLGAWLRTVARNRALDYVRSPGARIPWLAGRLDEVEDPALFVHFERRVSATHEIGKLFDALRKLSANQRAAIDLAYFTGLSQIEIAARMGRPLGTVKTWIRSSLKTLRLSMEVESDVSFSVKEAASSGVSARPEMRLNPRFDFGNATAEQSAVAPVVRPA